MTRSDQFHIHKITRRALALLVALACLLPAFAALAETADRAAAPEAEYLDDRRDSVRAAQNRLIDLELLDGGADGVFGPKTEAALREYQSRNDLEATGHLDTATLDKLTHVDPATATAKDAQQRLIDLGYLEGAADGVIGPRSVEALKQFQRVNGQEPNGKASEATLNALFSASAVAMPASLSGGSQGAEVKRLQEKLIQLGFLEGEADESYGQTTTAAVREFQQHLIDQGHGEDEIPVNGTATAMTQYCLLDEGYSSYLHDVELGQSDAEALRIERRLGQLGYMDLPADDVLDEYSACALALFKDEAGFDTVALADKETLDALFDADAPQAEYCVPHAIAKGDSGQVVRDVENALIYGGMLMKLPTGQYGDSVVDALGKLYEYLVAEDDPHAPMFADPKALSAEAVETLVDGLLTYRTVNAKSAAEIRRVQRRLYSLYYLEKSGVDGHLGSDSRDALKAFQEANDLKVTGKADGDTLDMLFSMDAQAKPYPYRVEVSIDEQLVRVYEMDENEVYQLVQTFTCSTGLNNTTPRGIFLNGHPVNRWHHFEKFNCWAQYSFEVTGDIMFHSVIYSSNTESSLRSGSLYALGNPASHGCIRLKVEDAKWLFEHCKRGTLAIVIY